MPNEAELERMLVRLVGDASQLIAEFKKAHRSISEEGKKISKSLSSMDKSMKNSGKEATKLQKTHKTSFEKTVKVNQRAAQKIIDAHKKLALKIVAEHKKAAVKLINQEKSAAVKRINEARTAAVKILREEKKLLSKQLALASKAERAKIAKARKGAVERIAVAKKAAKEELRTLNNALKKQLRVSLKNSLDRIRTEKNSLKKLLSEIKKAGRQQVALITSTGKKTTQAQRRSQSQQVRDAQQWAKRQLSIQKRKYLRMTRDAEQWSKRQLAIQKRKNLRLIRGTEQWAKKQLAVQKSTALKQIKLAENVARRKLSKQKAHFLRIEKDQQAHAKRSLARQKRLAVNEQRLIARTQRKVRAIRNRKQKQIERDLQQHARRMLAKQKRLALTEQRLIRRTQRRVKAIRLRKQKQIERDQQQHARRMLIIQKRQALQEIREAAKAQAHFDKRWLRRRKAIGEFGVQMRSLGRDFLRFATLPIIGAGVFAGFQFAQFDDAMTKSLSIMDDFGQETKQLKQLALELSTSGLTDKAPRELAEAYFYLASAGLDVQTSMKSLTAVTNFATAGNFSLQRATELLTDAQSALGKSYKKDPIANLREMLKLSDALVAANKIANADIEQFSQALTSKAATAMRTFKVEALDGISVLAAFADQGIKAEQGGERFARFLRLVGNAAVSNSTKWKELGIEIFTSTGSFKRMDEVVRELEKGLAGLSAKQRIARLGLLGIQARSQDAVFPLLDMSDALTDYRTRLDQAGISSQVAGDMMQSFGRQMKVVWNNVVRLAIEMGESLAPIIVKLSNWVIQGTLAWRSMSKENQQAIAVVALLAATIGPLLIVLGLLLTSLSIVSKGLAGLTAWLITVGGGMLKFSLMTNIANGSLIAFTTTLAVATFKIILASAAVIAVVAAIAALGYALIGGNVIELVSDLGKAFSQLFKTISSGKTTLDTSLLDSGMLDEMEGLRKSIEAELQSKSISAKIPLKLEFDRKGEAVKDFVLSMNEVKGANFLAEQSSDDLRLAIAELNSELQKTNMTMGMGSEQAKIYMAAQQGMSEASLFASRVLLRENEIKERKLELDKDATDAIKDLTLQMINFNATSLDEIVRTKQLNGLKGERLQQIKTLVAVRKAQNKEKEAIERAESVKESTLNNQDKFNKKQKELQDLFEKGLIGPETYSEAVKKAHKEAAKGAEDSAERIQHAVGGTADFYHRIIENRNRAIDEAKERNKLNIFDLSQESKNKHKQALSREGVQTSKDLREKLKKPLPISQFLSSPEELVTPKIPEVKLPGFDEFQRQSTLEFVGVSKQRAFTELAATTSLTKIQLEKVISQIAKETPSGESIVTEDQLKLIKESFPQPDQKKIVGIKRSLKEAQEKKVAIEQSLKSKSAEEITPQERKSLTVTNNTITSLKEQLKKELEGTPFEKEELLKIRLQDLQKEKDKILSHPNTLFEGTLQAMSDYGNEVTSYWNQAFTGKVGNLSDFDSLRDVRDKEQLKNNNIPQRIKSTQEQIALERQKYESEITDVIAKAKTFDAPRVVPEKNLKGEETGRFVTDESAKGFSAKFDTNVPKITADFLKVGKLSVNNIAEALNLPKPFNAPEVPAIKKRPIPKTKPKGQPNFSVPDPIPAGALKAFKAGKELPKTKVRTSDFSASAPLPVGTKDVVTSSAITVANKIAEPVESLRKEISTSTKSTESNFNDFRKESKSTFASQSIHIRESNKTKIPNIPSAPTPPIIPKLTKPSGQSFKSVSDNIPLEALEAFKLGKEAPKLTGTTRLPKQPTVISQGHVPIKAIRSTVGATKEVERVKDSSNSEKVSSDKALQSYERVRSRRLEKRDHSREVSRLKESNNTFQENNREYVELACKCVGEGEKGQVKQAGQALMAIPDKLPTKSEFLAKLVTEKEKVENNNSKVLSTGEFLAKLLTTKESKESKELRDSKSVTNAYSTVSRIKDSNSTNNTNKITSVGEFLSNFFTEKISKELKDSKELRDSKSINNASSTVSKVQNSNSTKVENNNSKVIESIKRQEKLKEVLAENSDHTEKTNRVIASIKRQKELEKVLNSTFSDKKSSDSYKKIKELSTKEKEIKSEIKKLESRRSEIKNRERTFSESVREFLQLITNPLEGFTDPNATSIKEDRIEQQLKKENISNKLFEKRKQLSSVQFEKKRIVEESKKHSSKVQEESKKTEEIKKVEEKAAAVKALKEKKQLMESIASQKPVDPLQTSTVKDSVRYATERILERTKEVPKPVEVPKQKLSRRQQIAQAIKERKQKKIANLQSKSRNKIVQRRNQIANNISSTTNSVSNVANQSTNAPVTNLPDHIKKVGDQYINQKTGEVVQNMSTINKNVAGAVQQPRHTVQTASGRTLDFGKHLSEREKKRIERIKEFTKEKSSKEKERMERIASFKKEESTRKEKVRTGEIVNNNQFKSRLEKTKFLPTIPAEVGGTMMSISKEGAQVGAKSIAAVEKKKPTALQENRIHLAQLKERFKRERAGRDARIDEINATMPHTKLDPSSAQVRANALRDVRTTSDAVATIREYGGQRALEPTIGRMGQGFDSPDFKPERIEPKLEVPLKEEKKKDEEQKQVTTLENLNNTLLVLSEQLENGDTFIRGNLS